MLDVNAGIPLADEPRILAECIQLVQSLTDVPLSIDSSIVAALEAGLAVYKGKAAGQLGHRRGGAAGERCCRWSRSTTPRSSPSPTTRPASPRTPTCASRSPRRSSSARADYGIPYADIVVDPLVMPIGAINHAGRAGVPPDPPPARGAEGQHHLRRLQRQLRPAEPARAQRRLPGDGDRRRHDLGDHQPAACRGACRRCWAPT